MDQHLVGLAFGAGLVAVLNPCGFAMLPTYLTLVVRGDATGRLTALGRAIGATAEMILGFMTVFGTCALLTVSLLSTVQRYLAYATVLIGIVLVALGGWLLSGRPLWGWCPLNRRIRSRAPRVCRAPLPLGCTSTELIRGFWRWRCWWRARSR